MKSSDKVIQEYFTALLNDGSEDHITHRQSEDSPSYSDQARSASKSVKPETISVVTQRTSSSVTSKVIAKRVTKEPITPTVKRRAKPLTERPKLLKESDVQPVAMPAVTAAPLQRLLDGVAEKRAEPVVEVIKPISVEAPSVDAEISESEPELTVVATGGAGHSALTVQPAEPEDAFQVLYFEVAGMTLAVPLEQLGGIYNVVDDSVRQLIGKPEWFMGLMPHRERQLSVVDTALWVMPEKYDEALAEKLNYQYLVMLKDSDWGLACERLITTSPVEPLEVNWRKTMGKRPWLRGMVKEKMCALLNVDALTELLDTGLNSQNI